MRKNIINEHQPFGVVHNEKSMGGTGRPMEMGHKSLGAQTVRANHGADHGPSFADKNPSAHSDACAHVDNPFFWTGRPKRS